MPERKFDGFDEFALDYRKVHSKNISISGADSNYFAEMKVKWLGTFEKNVPLKVLDLGCGDGTTALYFQQHFPQWKITGIDVSAKSIEQAKDKELSNAEFKVYDGEHIPFEAETFDLVFVAGVFHHVAFEYHAQLAAEIKRVMKGGARLYFFEHNPLNPLTRYLVNTCVFDKDAKLLRSNYAVSLLERNGFGNIRKRFIIFFPRKGWLSSFIFLEKYLQKIPLGGQFVLVAIKPTNAEIVHEVRLFIQQ
jgi:ubiquinone/menaquinone biosynthesis C-methylase UbiE